MNDQHEYFDTPFETIDLALMETVDGGRGIKWEKIKKGAEAVWDTTKKVGGKVLEWGSYIGSGAAFYELGKGAYDYFFPGKKPPGGNPPIEE